MPKPQSSLLKLFRLRIDTESEEKIVQFCKKYLEGYILVHHVLPHGNPHYHVYAETRLTQGNLSNKIKSDLGVTGGQYCTQKCDPERAVEFKTYLFNSKNGNKAKLIMYNCCSLLDIHTYRVNSNKITREFEAQQKRAKKSQYEIVQAVLDKMEGKVHLVDPIYDMVIETLKESKMMARPNHVKDIIATVMAYGKSQQLKDNIKLLTMRFFSQ